MINSLESGKIIHLGLWDKSGQAKSLATDQSTRGMCKNYLTTKVYHSKNEKSTGYLERRNHDK